MSDSAPPRTAARQASLSITNSWSLPKLMSITISRRLLNLWWCHATIPSSVPPFSSYLQSFPASGSFHIRWPKYWSLSLSFSIGPSSEYSGQISNSITFKSKLEKVDPWLLLFRKLQSSSWEGRIGLQQPVLCLRTQGQPGQLLALLSPGVWAGSPSEGVRPEVWQPLSPGPYGLVLSGQQEPCWDSPRVSRSLPLQLLCLKQLS